MRPETLGGFSIWGWLASSWALHLTEKVQALLPALTIPMIALTFGKDERNVGAPTVSRGEWLRAVALCAIGLAVLFPTIGLLEQGISSMPTSHITPNVPGHGPVYYRPLSGGLSGIYQWLLVYLRGRRHAALRTDLPR